LENIISFSALEYDEKYKIFKSQIITMLTMIEKRLKNSKNLIDNNNLSIYSEISFEQIVSFKDPNETCNREKLNLLCAYFILNDIDLDLNKTISDLFRKLCIRLPYLVCKTLFIIFLFRKLYNNFN
jgi:hypothetical protein